MRRRLPKPQGIDEATGFKVDLSALKKQWDGALTVDPDKRNPQDMIRVRAETVALADPSPEPADVYYTTAIMWEDGLTQMMGESSGTLILETSIERTLP